MSRLTGVRRPLAMSFLVLGGALALLVGVLWGPVSYSLAEVLGALASPDTPASMIVRQLRLPRVFLAFGVGGSLAVAVGLC